MPQRTWIQSCEVAAQRVAWWSRSHCGKCPLTTNPMACWTSGVGVLLASETGQKSMGDFPIACKAAASAGAWSPECETWVLASVSYLLPSSEQRQCSQQEVEGGSVNTRSINSASVSESSKDSPCPDCAWLESWVLPFPICIFAEDGCQVSRGNPISGVLGRCLCICLQKVGSEMWGKQCKCRI